MIYLDTSAVAKLLIAEAETTSMRSYFAGDRRFISSRLLEVELHAIADRRRLAAEPIREVLDQITLVSLDDATLDSAISLHSGLRTLDALHLATATRLREVITGILTFDAELSSAASRLGIPAVEIDDPGHA